MKSKSDHNAQRAVTTDLEVRVDRIPEEGLDLDEVLTERWVNDALGEGSPVKASADGRLVVHIAKAERVVHVRGRATVGLAGSCVRCLGATELALDVPIEVAIFPKGEEPVAAPDGEVANEDMGVSTYDEGVVDLAGVVHDEVFLELPMNPLCKEDCAGLCPKCGANLNEGRCGCEPDVDPRWQALRSMKAD